MKANPQKKMRLGERGERETRGIESDTERKELVP